MALFGSKKGDKEEEKKGPIVGFTKSKRFLFFKIKSKPVYAGGQPDPSAGGAQQPQQQNKLRMPDLFSKKPQAQRPPQANRQARAIPNPFAEMAKRMEQPYAQKQQLRVQPQAIMSGMGRPAGKPNQLQMYLISEAGKHKDLEAALRAENIKESPYEFVRKMFIYSAIVAAIIGISVSALLISYGVTPVLGIVLGIASYYGLFNRFIRYPLDRSKVVGKEIEKDILFAARDLVISMRSGMPLFNAITAVSTGYGAASLEFAKVVELVQLGQPIEQALDDVSTRSQSKTFKRIMLQATVSLKAGADVVGALQGVVDEVEQERVIELRRYGQRLNALAMFYMLFGVIFPSMGIAVAAILTTFINLFTVDQNTLLFALVGIFFLQIIFLNIMRSSRPTFAM
ncbi:MAG: type II secretion system F family protein [Candidatus Micrarchaeota archaeon]|nr:type II secretion system F family protein [Candidatus Micrarchaeota archaeon]